MNARGDYEIKNGILQIAMIGSGFVAEFYMQGFDNMNHPQVAVNYSATAAHADALYEPMREAVWVTVNY